LSYRCWKEKNTKVFRRVVLLCIPTAISATSFAANACGLQMVVSISTTQEVVRPIQCRLILKKFPRFSIRNAD
jgi:hypothetical protein